MTVTTGVNKKTKKEKKKKTVLQEIVGFVLDLLVVFALFMVITTFVAEPVWVKGTSMTNTLQNNELLLVSKRAYGEGTKGMERGDYRHLPLPRPYRFCHPPGGQPLHYQAHRLCETAGGPAR